MGDTKIQSVYEDYFEIIENYYGRYFKKDDPLGSVNQLLKKPMTARILYQTSDTIAEEVERLFKKKAESLKQDMLSLKGVNANFCGDFSPNRAKEYVAKTGLYVDTNIIPDPLTSSLLLKERLKPVKFTQLFFKHAFNMLDLKEAMINDSEKPILRIIPRSIFWQDGRPKDEDVNIKTIEYFNELFGDIFSDKDSLDEFIESNPDLKKLISMIKNKDVLKPRIANSKNLKQGFNDFLEEARFFDSETKGVADALYTNVMGSMVRNGSDIMFSEKFKIINSFDEINSWHYYKWFLQKQEKQLGSESFVLNSITLDKVKWIGNLKIDDVIKAREKSCLQDFREILNKEFSRADSDDITKVASQVNYNLEQAFKKHEKKLKKIESNFNFGYAGSSTSIVSGTIGLLGGIASQNIVASIGGGLAIAGGLIPWIKTNLDYNKKQDIINSPLGLLFEEHKND